MKPYGIIYLATNKVNQKKYVGQTTTTLNKRRTGHFVDSHSLRKNNRQSSNKFARALRKYGKHNFEWSIVESCYSNQQDLDILEDKYIVHYDSIKNGYNIRCGGKGRGPLSEETKEKLRQIWNEPGRREAASAIRKGKPMSDEHKKNLSNAKKGKPSARKGTIQGPEPMEKRLTKSNTIKCLETKEIFYSIREMGRKLNISRAPLQKFLRGDVDHVRGYTFIICISDSRKNRY